MTARSWRVRPPPEIALPLTIPAFVQYQSPMFPLRGLWNRAPQEGDQFVNVEIDWLVSPPGSAVQFSLSGNSPVALSQIVALYVDNGRSGVDVDFIFPDSGFVLTVPAHNQGLFPVLTNALMFYASAQSSAAGDITIVQILNSMPPPIPIVASSAQNHVSLAGLTLANGTSTIIAAGINGTLNTLSLSVSQNAAAGTAILAFVDGTGRTVWVTLIELQAAQNSIPIELPSLAVRFVNGLSLAISSSTLTGTIQVNAYYTTP